jgi:predicted nuclease of predicted toxin-antitoxin system
MLKFLADVNIEKDVVDFLKKQGFDVLWIPDYDCRLEDDDLLELANKEKRILITNDTDFGEIVFLQKKISKGIVLIRVKGQEVHIKLRVLRKLIKFHSDKLKNSFIVVSDRRIRIRPMEEI